MGGWSDFTLAIKYIFSGWWITLQWRQRMHGAPSAPIEPHAERTHDSGFGLPVKGWSEVTISRATLHKYWCAYSEYLVD